ncbi:hypothetical protein [Larkinella soli]|uniref:hypothetical protein n=1 Tax=Larkinella soli TaxID=1770527 RepID=UPI000FFC1E72|nr:hypothetical protein [Larkinella soli]
MTLTKEQCSDLKQRLYALSDFGGEKKVAELAGVTTRVIQKVKTGGNVRVETMEAILNALVALEAERSHRLEKLGRILPPHP